MEQQPGARGRMARLAASPQIIRRTVKGEDGQERVEVYTLSPIAITPLGAVRTLVRDKIDAEYDDLIERMSARKAPQKHIDQLNDDYARAIRNPMASDWAREADVVVEVVYWRLHKHHSDLTRPDVIDLLDDDQFFAQIFAAGRDLDEVDDAAKKPSRAKPKRAKAARKSGSRPSATSPRATGGPRRKSGK